MKKVPQYNPAKVEKEWQKQWEQDQLYRADDASTKPKFYQLETFPYPSAAGLHVGHPKGYIAEDIHARYQRMLGREVLYTMGWDAFGLPTENYAIKIGKSPKEVARENIKNFKRQVQMFGLSYDWEREINTSSPEYYRWTQWLFIQLYKKGLAYRKQAKINWCSKDQTVLANEQVVDGCCERCGTLVEQREMEQWFFKITDYADRLLTGLEQLDWPAATKKRQEDWIGKSEGAVIEFALAQIPGQEDNQHKVQVFTTRPDTLFGATFLVISPELAQKWIEVGWQASEAVQEYINQSLRKRELERMEATDKSGVDSGIVAINPATQERIPVWIADYVLGGYGTGAIMAVPAHDERDFEFAQKFDLKVQPVIKSEGEGVYVGAGELINSGQFDGLTSEEAKTKITEFVKGQFKTQYRIRDWSVSRQRYWGVPIPMIHCSVCGAVPVPEEDLPVKLPDLEDYRPTGIPPLASSKEFIETTCPNCGAAAKRDSETLDTFVDSSWYYLRYTDPHNDQVFAAKEKLQQWMPVQLYVIGAEHTNLHLLYARFITKFLNEAGYLNFQEPFLKLRHVGLIRGADGQKMSKSKGNVVNPDEIVGEYGADTVRLYEMFMGPFEDGQPWDSKGVLGAHRFLYRVWKFVHDHATDEITSDSREVQTALNQTIKSVGEDIAAFRFNTAVSGLMKLLNTLEGQEQVSGEAIRTLLMLLAPLAPHISEELWRETLGQSESVHRQAWPQYDAALLVSDTMQIPVQINGKVREVLTVASGASDTEIEAAARQSAAIQSYLTGQTVRKVIVVPGKLINFVL